jgi:hypothetical protein
MAWSLNRWYKHYNRLYHDNKLPPCECRFATQQSLGHLRMGSLHAVHVTVWVKKKGKKVFAGHKIWITEKCVPHFEEYALVLLHHEMLHVKLYGKRKANHGPRFQRARRRLYKQGAILFIL